MGVTGCRTSLGFQDRAGWACPQKTWVHHLAAWGWGDTRVAWEDLMVAWGDRWVKWEDLQDIWVVILVIWVDHQVGWGAS